MSAHYLRWQKCILTYYKKYNGAFISSTLAAVLFVCLWRSNQRAEIGKYFTFLTACLVPCVLISQIFYGRSLKALGRRWLKFNIFTLLIWLTLSWRLDTFSVQWNPHGIELASLISLRMNLILCATWLLLLNVNEVMLVQAISRLPLSSKLIHLFVLSIRYIPY
ncbi:ABC transporter permease [Actinobacillus equuli]|nr:ABC transporter permease [Actinobacillus equuli]